MNVTICHHPDCGTSRNTLAMIRNAGMEPVIVEYLKNPPNRGIARERAFERRLAYDTGQRVFLFATAPCWCSIPAST